MRKSILFCFCLFCCLICVAQEQERKEKVAISVDLGGGKLFGTTNLSPFGEIYRQQYDKGFSGSIKATYRFQQNFQVGLKYNLFGATADFALHSGEWVNSDLSLNYLAPQIGCRYDVTDRLIFDFMCGAGYAYYKNSGVCDGESFKAKKGFGASNFDCSFYYRLYPNLYSGLGCSFTGGKASSYEMNGHKVELEGRNELKLFRGDIYFSVRSYF